MATSKQIVETVKAAGIEDRPGVADMTTRNRMARSVIDARARRITPAQFEQRFQNVLIQANTRAYAAGLQAVSPAATMLRGDFQVIKRLTVSQHDYIAGYARDIASSSEPIHDEIRLGMYDESVRTSYQAGTLAGYIAEDVGMVAWVGGGDCDPCSSAIANSPYLPADLPGLPGIGFCAGGGRCRCDLIPA